MITTKINGECLFYPCNPALVSCGDLSAPLKWSSKWNNLVTLVVHVLGLPCSLNQSALERQIMQGRHQDFFPIIVFSWTSMKKASIFFVLGYYQILLCLSHVLTFQFQAGYDTICSHSVTLVTLSCCARHLSDKSGIVFGRMCNPGY